MSRARRQALTRSGLLIVGITSHTVAFALHSVPGVGTLLLVRQMLELLYLPCAIIILIMLDSVIISEPRLRFFHGFIILLEMCVRVS